MGPKTKADKAAETVQEAGTGTQVPEAPAEAVQAQEQPRKTKVGEGRPAPTTPRPKATPGAQKPQQPPPPPEQPAPVTVQPQAKATPPFPAYIMEAIFGRDTTPPGDVHYQQRKRRHQDLFAASLTGLLASSDKTLHEILEEAGTSADAALLFEEHRYGKRGLPAIPKIDRA